MLLLFVASDYRPPIETGVDPMFNVTMFLLIIIKLKNAYTTDKLRCFANDGYIFVPKFPMAPPTWTVHKDAFAVRLARMDRAESWFRR